MTDYWLALMCFLIIALIFIVGEGVARLGELLRWLKRQMEDSCMD